MQKNVDGSKNSFGSDWKWGNEELPAGWIELKIKVMKWFDMKLKWKNAARSILKICMDVIVICRRVALKQML